MFIRKAKQEDVEEVSALYIKVFNEAFPNEHWDHEDALNLFNYWMERQQDIFYVAEDNGKIIGGMVANIKPWWDGNRFQDGELFVDTEYQKKGIGTKLFIKLLEEAMRIYNVNSIEGITSADESFPRGWYDKIGHKVDKSLVVVTGNCREILNKLKGRQNNSNTNQ